jgi:chaperonin cofactor prefoldin
MDALVGALSESERLGSEIIAKRAEIVELDRRRNKNREALRSMMKAEKAKQEKIYLCSGNMFIKTPIVKAKDLIEIDQKDLDQNINTLRDEIKETTEELRKFEGKPSSGFDLKGMTSNETAALRDLLPTCI